MTLRLDLDLPGLPVQYGTEVLCAVRNPQLVAVPEAPPAGRATRDGAIANAAVFLADFYRAQQA